MSGVGCRERVRPARRGAGVAARLLLAVSLVTLAFGAGAQRMYEDFVRAVRDGDMLTAKALLARGIDPDTVDQEGDPVLLVAARQGSLDMVNLLLAARPRVDQANRFGDTAMMVAALKGHLPIVRALRENGASVVRPGWNPLIYAATGGNTDVLRYLLRQGAEINGRSPNGTTALMMAVRESHVDGVALLIAAGADAALVNDNGASALVWAERGGNARIIELVRHALQRR